MGFATVTGGQTTMFANNVDFTGNANPSPQVNANGQLLIGSGTAPFIQIGTLTSPRATISIGYAAPNITIDVVGGTTVIETITGDSGGAQVPSAGNFNFSGGTTGLTFAGTAHTETLIGILNLAHGGTSASLTANNGGVFYSTASTGAILAGTTTATQMLQSGSSSAPAWSTTTWPATSTINQILYSSAANTISGLATADNGVLTTGTSGIPVITALSSNGQLIIGSGSGAPIAATLTGGTGVTITNAANSITIAATGGSFAWMDVATATQALSVQTGYITDHSGGVVYTLPATASIGDQIRILGKQTSWSIAQNATQQILVSSASSTIGTGGSVASTNLGDCIWLVCITAGTATVWRAESFVGNLTVT